MDSPRNCPPAPFWRHLLAMLYDCLLIIPLFMGATAIWVSIWGPTADIQHPTVPPYVQWLSWAAILIMFFGIFWRRGGQTLGMQAWRIKLETADGATVSWRQILLRISGALVSLGALGLGYGWRFLPPERRYWHDTWSDTRLILTPKRR